MKASIKWLIIAGACALTLTAFLWLLMMLSAGLALGWSDRSPLQLAVLFVIGLGLPIIATTVFAKYAILSAKAENFKAATAWLLASVCPIPLLYLAWFGLGLRL